MLAALLVLATTPHHTAVRGSHPPSAPAIVAGKGPAGNVTTHVSSGLPPMLGRAIPANALIHGALPGPAAVPSGITAHLPAGERAFSLRVGEDDIIGGFLQSGNQVDVLATIPSSAFPQEDAIKRADRSSAILLLQNIRVLAVGSTLTAGAVQADARTVSLALAPEQLVRLTLALRLGKVSLAVRRPGDDSVSTIAAATLTDLLPVEHAPEAPPPRAPAPAAGPHIIFYAGTRTTTMNRDGGQ